MWGMKHVLAVLAMCLCLPVMGADKAKKKTVVDIALEKLERFEMWKVLAEAGAEVAQNVIGNMYCDGEGVKQDFKEAVKWYHKAAVQGDAAAQANLGIMYATGEGVLEDDVTAYAWWNIAAANGGESGKKNKLRIAKKMTPDQIAEAQKLSREMIKKNPKLLQKKK